MMPRTLALLAAAATASHAFLVAPQRATPNYSAAQTIAGAAPTTVALHLSRIDESADEQQTEAASPAVDKEESPPVSAESSIPEEVEEEVEEEEAVVEDPEVTALKQEIAKLEGEVKSARRKAMDKADQAEEYTKTGYARKVAEMENMRRARSMLQSSNKFSATASVLTEFVPIMDRLYELKEAYGDDDFGKQYSALPGAIKASFTSMGVTDFSVDAGDTVDANRMTVVESEYNSDAPKDTVLRSVAPGMELSGNTIRPALVVASLGSQEETAEVAVDEVDGQEGSAAPENN